MYTYRNLLDCDVFSKSDPMCVVLMKTLETSKWNEICRTECINNSLNPNFVKKVLYFLRKMNMLMINLILYTYTQVQLLYRFEVQQLIKFSVYDVDSRINDLSAQDFLGSCETTLGHVTLIWFPNFKLNDYYCYYYYFR